MFPERIELSRGEPFTFSVVVLDAQGRRVSEPRVAWSIPQELGSITPQGKLTLSGPPGEYSASVRATVTMDGPDGPIAQEVSASVVIRGPLARINIVPTSPSVVVNGRVQFRAVAYDANGVTLPDIFFRWSIADEHAGAISSSGAFRAGRIPSNYLNAIKVQVIARPG
ncbi:MAG: hypothetical protein EXR67_01235 [Dehalococcoidia bacterium]|nr:hypothetical protein [Dehalococcoidia bacterium]